MLGVFGEQLRENSVNVDPVLFDQGDVEAVESNEEVKQIRIHNYEFEGHLRAGVVVAEKSQRGICFRVWALEIYVVKDPVVRGPDRYLVKPIEGQYEVEGKVQHEYFDVRLFQ